MIPFIDRNKYLIGSLCISATVVFWDCLFAIEHFGVNKYLAVLMMIEVELSYIALPYMQEPEQVLSVKEKKKWKNKLPSLNKIMWTIFFLASMTPAALQISDLLLEKIVNKVTTEPTTPVKPSEIKVDFDIQKEEWNKWQINQNKDLTDYQKMSELTKVENRLNQLKDQKSKYTNALSQYNDDLQAYPERKRKYDEYKAKGSITFLFAYISLILGFIIMVSLQVMNGYASRKGAKERGINQLIIPNLSKKEIDILLMGKSNEEIKGKEEPQKKESQLTTFEDIQSP